MPTTRRACRAALFQSIGDDVLTHVLATMTSFADRSAINSVSKRWKKVVDSKAFAQARREVGETGLVLVGYPLYRDPTQRFTRNAVVESTAAFIVADGNRVLRGPGINSMGLECAVLGEEVVAVGMSAGNVMKAFNVSRGSWRDLAAPPNGEGRTSVATLFSATRRGVTHEGLRFEVTRGDPVDKPAVAVANGRLFCMGGGVEPRLVAGQEFPDDDRWQPPPPVSNGVYEYDAATDSWHERAPMRFPVRDGACAAVGNKICVLGGIDFSAGGNGFGGQVDVIQVYDVETDTWDVIGNDGRHFACAHATAIGNRIYYSGGISSGHAQRFVEWYDPNDRLATWTCVPRGAEEVSQWFHADDRDEWNRPEWPPILWCPSGCLDGRYVVFDQKNTIQVLNDYNTWTPLVTLPGTFEHPAMASRVPLI